MQTVGLSVILGADFSSAEEAMAKFRQSVNNLASETSKAFANMAGTASNIGNAFKPVSDGAKNATQIVINESKARVQADNEETQAALNASKLKIQALREQQAAQRAATQAKKAEKDEYGQLVAKNQALVREYYNASAALIRYGEASGFTAQKIEEMAIKAREGQEQLKQIEAGAGRFQRNVGNYSGALTFLNQSIAQISGEIPNFFQSLKIGFMSIGNNIGQVVQGIQLLRKENASLLAQGKQTQSVIGAVAKSLFGWQTLLFVGVGLITRYGASLIDWATGADKAKAAAEELKKQQEAWNQITQSSNKTAADQIAKLEVLNSTMTDNNLSMKQRVAAYNEAKKLYPSYLENLTKDKALNTGIADVINNDLIPAIMAAATARAYEGKISEQITKKIELEEKRKVAAYKRSQAETDVLNARLNARDNKQLAAGNAGTGAANGMGDNATLVAANKRYNEAGKEVFALDEQIRAVRGNITGLAEDYKDSAEKMGQLTSQGIDPLTHKTKQAKEKIDALTKAQNDFNAELAQTDAKLKAGVIDSFEAMKEKISAVGQHLDKLFKNGGTQDAIQKDIELLRTMNYELSAMAKIDLNSAKGFQFGGSAEKEFHQMITYMDQVRDKASKLYNELGIQDPKDEIKRRDAVGALDAAGIDATKYVDFKKPVKEQAEEAKKAMKELQDKFNKFANGIGSSLSRPIEDMTQAIFDGKNAMDALGASVKNIVADLVKAVAKAGLLSLIGNKDQVKSIGGFGGILGSLLGIGIPFLADGGVVTKPTLAMIGEAGPEAVQPLSKLNNYSGPQQLTLRTKWRGRDIEGATDRYNSLKDY